MPVFGRVVRPDVGRTVVPEPGLAVVPDDGRLVVPVFGRVVEQVLRIGVRPASDAVHNGQRCGGVTTSGCGLGTAGRPSG